jgi:hypothetical protein
MSHVISATTPEPTAVTAAKVQFQAHDEGTGLATHVPAVPGLFDPGHVHENTSTTHGFYMTSYIVCCLTLLSSLLFRLEGIFTKQP